MCSEMSLWAWNSRAGKNREVSDSPDFYQKTHICLLFGATVLERVSSRDCDGVSVVIR